tara:strand:- start:73 stop:1119 length:1047 start_codon:yes stop_codon:yes gene_type:complete
MSQTTYSKPELFIDGNLIEYLESYSFSTSLNNTFQTLKVNSSDPDLHNISLFGKKVELFQNYGNYDGTPLFRGYITQFSNKETSFSISAQDPRVFLAGKDGVTVTLTEKDNYDGFTLTQFLYSFITDEINVESTVIGLSALTEVDKPTFMTGIRAEAQAPWQLLTSTLQRSIDDDNPAEPLDYFTDIIHRKETSDLIFRKKRALTDRPSLRYSYNDGIVSISFKERPPNSIGVAKTKDGKIQEFVYGNTPKGRVAVTLDEQYNTPAEAQTAARNKILLEYEDTKEMKIDVSKGHNLTLGSIIDIDVPDDEIRGVYRITGKNINYKGNSFTCSLSCNKKPIKVSDFFSS